MRGWGVRGVAFGLALASPLASMPKVPTLKSRVRLERPMEINLKPAFNCAAIF